MKTALPAMLFLFLSSCFTQQPLVKKEADNNVTYKVEYLFEHEGCKVYRFYDRGDYIYFTNCAGQTIATTDSTQRYNTTTLKK